MTRVLIADDQAIVRAGFRMILEAQDDIEVVAEADNGTDAVQLAHDTEPDVCLLDIRMPGINGLQATRKLAGPGVSDPIKVVVVTTFDLDEYVAESLRNGASGFLLKDAGPTLLIEAIHAAERGDALVSPQITVRLLRHFARSTTKPSSPVPEPQEPLTARELDVVRATAHGLTNTEIADALFMSLSTVKTHLSAAQAKLNARNRVETAAWAWRSGLMDEDVSPDPAG